MAALESKETLDGRADRRSVVLLVFPDDPSGVIRISLADHHADSEDFGQPGLALTVQVAVNPFAQQSVLDDRRLVVIVKGVDRNGFVLG